MEGGVEGGGEAGDRERGRGADGAVGGGVSAGSARKPRRAWKSRQDKRAGRLREGSVLDLGWWEGWGVWWRREVWQFSVSLVRAGQLHTV